MLRLLLYDMDDKCVEVYIHLVRERKVIWTWSKRENGHKDSRGIKNNNYKDIVAKLDKAFPDAPVPFTGMFYSCYLSYE